MKNCAAIISFCLLSLFAFEASSYAASSTGENEAADKSSRTYSSGDTLDLLRKAQSANEDLYNSLQSFVCDEKIRRVRASLDLSNIRPVDTLTARVSFENGNEHYTDVRRNKGPRARLSNVSGAWSEGEFGTLLRQTQQLLKVQQVTSEGLTALDGAPAVVYTFEVSKEQSPWNLIVEGRSYPVPFRTQVWVSETTGQILKVSRVSTWMDPELRISELLWSVSLQMVNLNGAQWLLPTSGEYSVFYEAENRREWNRLNFTNYHRYGSEASLRFTEIDPTPATAPRGSAALPSQYER